jgi:AraC family transcriptional regulator of adaptative response/methylated-DNA-[protein]-cysteine methyltransferase
MNHRQDGKIKNKGMEIQQIRGIYDQPIHFEGRSASEKEADRTGMTLYYGFHESPFGNYLLALTRHGEITALEFETEKIDPFKAFKSQWPNSNLIHWQEKSDPVASRLFPPASDEPLRLLAWGTSFQLKVWERLLDIPFGKTHTYQGVAEKVGTPRGYQAVGNAMGKNPIAFLIPCHRVVKKDDQIAGYRWGIRRKAVLLEWELSLTGQQRRLF